jgi:hypothetical protein
VARLEVADDLREAEETDRERDEVQPTEELGTPKVKRGTPVNLSCPIVPSSRPSTIMASALTVDPLASAMLAMRPRTTMAK